MEILFDRITVAFWRGAPWLHLWNKKCYHHNWVSKMVENHHPWWFSLCFVEQSVSGNWKCSWLQWNVLERTSVECCRYLTHLIGINWHVFHRQWRWQCWIFGVPRTVWVLPMKPNSLSLVLDCRCLVVSVSCFFVQKHMDLTNICVLHIFSLI